VRRTRRPRGPARHHRRRAGDVPAGRAGPPGTTDGGRATYPQAAGAPGTA